jgi:16S rRNA (cytosine1402-N4)-methyltransferase
VNVENEYPPIEHIPVLKQALAERISLPRDGTVVDATVGHGGHSLLFGSLLGPEGTIFGLDIDEECLERAHFILSDLPCKVVLVRENFACIADVMGQQGVEKVDLIIADLGFCSAQVSDPQKGMSFQENMPLDMRLDPRLKKTARDIVNTLDEKSLADLIYNYGQDRASRRIARFIVEYRKSQPITTTAQLVAVVCRALNQPQKGGKYKIHPATRTFQALRIAVNDELESLKKMLASGPDLLTENGLIAVISFHSLEDAIVKKDFRHNKGEGIYEILTKKPITALRTEVLENPRARSAKLRIARRI